MNFHLSYHQGQKRLLTQMCCSCCLQQAPPPWGGQGAAGPGRLALAGAPQARVPGAGGLAQPPPDPSARQQRGCPGPLSHQGSPGHACHQHGDERQPDRDGADEAVLVFPSRILLQYCQLQNKYQSTSCAMTMGNPSLTEHRLAACLTVDLGECSGDSPLTYRVWHGWRRAAEHCMPGEGATCSSPPCQSWGG